LRDDASATILVIAVALKILLKEPVVCINGTSELNEVKLVKTDDAVDNDCRSLFSELNRLLAELLKELVGTVDVPPELDRNNDMY
jgi:hypothetical protein